MLNLNPFKKKDTPTIAPVKKPEPLGDGKAVFMDEGYSEEYEDLQKEESGLKPWYKRIGL